MQDHIHPGKTGGGIILLLHIDGQTMGSLIRPFQDKRPGTSRRIIDRLATLCLRSNPDNLSHDPGDL